MRQKRLMLWESMRESILAPSALDENTGRRFLPASHPSRVDERDVKNANAIGSSFPFTVMPSPPQSSETTAASKMATTTTTQEHQHHTTADVIVDVAVGDAIIPIHEQQEVADGVVQKREYSIRLLLASSIESNNRKQHGTRIITLTQPHVPLSPFLYSRIRAQEFSLGRSGWCLRRSGRSSPRSHQSSHANGGRRRRR